MCLVLRYSLQETFGRSFAEANVNEYRFVLPAHLQEGARGGNVSLGWLHTQQALRDREETFLREKSPLT